MSRPRALQGLTAAGVLSLALAVTGCTGSPSAAPNSAAASNSAAMDPDDEASAVVSSLGAVPIPTGETVDRTPSASPRHPAVLAIGGPVRVSLAGGTQAVVTALGPEQVSLGAGAPSAGVGPEASTKAVITLRLATTKGTGTVASSEISSRDETGSLIRLSPVGPAAVQLKAGSTSELKVSGTFDSGAAQVTWRHAGDVVAVWTFNIELD